MTSKPTNPELEPLDNKQLASFKKYAEASRTEPNGDQCQWADYTLRLIAEVERSRQREKKYEEWLLIQLDGLHRSSGVEASRGAAHAFTRAIEVFQSLKAQPHQEGTEIGES